ncbi:MAG: OmpH family outer membrane protein [Pseudomonadales bacterium]
MRNLLKGLLVALGISLSSLAAADKIAIFSPEKAIFDTQAAIQLGQQLSEQLQPQSQRLESVGQELQALQKRLEEDQALLSSEELQQLQQQINQQSQVFQQLNQYLNNAKLQTEQEFLQLMRPKLDEVLTKYIEANNISLILNRNAVVYVQDDIEITAAITALLDEK